MARTKTSVKTAASQSTKNAGKVLGYWAYWDCFHVNVKRSDFIKLLSKMGLSDWEQYAPEISTQAAFKRAVLERVERNDLSLVSKDSERTIYQVNQMSLEEDALTDDVTQKASYDYVCRVAISKKALHEGKGPNEFIVSDNKELKKTLVSDFIGAKETYLTKEFRKFVKRVFAHEADLIRMRRAGGVYFVPPEGKAIGDKMLSIFEKIPGESAFDFVPMPDVSSGRRALKRAVVDEAQDMIEHLKSSIGNINSESNRINSITDNRLKEVMKIRTKVQSYATYLGNKATEFNKELKTLEKEIKAVITG